MSVLVIKKKKKKTSKAIFSKESPRKVDRGRCSSDMEKQRSDQSTQNPVEKHCCLCIASRYMDRRLAMPLVVVVLHAPLHTFHRLELSLGKKKHATFSDVR